jgi:hypothetical protein
VLCSRSAWYISTRLHGVTSRIILIVTIVIWGTRWRSWLRHYATSRKVAGSIPDGDIGIFHWLNPSDRTMTLGSTEPVRKMSTRNISGCEGDRCLGLTTLPPSCVDCLEIWESQPPGALRPVHGLLFLYHRDSLKCDIIVYDINTLGSVILRCRRRRKLESRIFVLNRYVKRAVWRRWEDNIKLDLQEVEGGWGDWIELAQDRDMWRALVSTVRNLRVPKMRGISWLAVEPVSFSRRTLLHGVSK